LDRVNKQPAKAKRLPPHRHLVVEYTPRRTIRLPAVGTCLYIKCSLCKVHTPCTAATALILCTTVDVRHRDRRLSRCLCDRKGQPRAAPAPVVCDRQWQTDGHVYSCCSDRPCILKNTLYTCLHGIILYTLYRVYNLPGARFVLSQHRGPVPKWTWSQASGSIRYNYAIYTYAVLLSYVFCDRSICIPILYYT